MAAFYLRMAEHGRDQPRVDVVNELRSVVRQNGFRPVLVGGVYELEGQLAQLVASSLVKGLLGLMIFFTAVAWIVGRSLRTAAAMIFSLSLVPVCMLGGIGLLNIPVDIISAPATNVCIGMAIDSMVHLVFSVRRAQYCGPAGLGGVGQRASRAMARDRFLGCRHRRRFRDFRALQLPSHTTVWSRRLGRYCGRYPGKSFCSPRLGWGRIREAIGGRKVKRTRADCLSH